MRFKWLAASLIAVAVIGGCGGGDGDGGDDSAAGGGDTTATVEPSGGSESDGRGEAIDVAPFTMPLPPGAVHENFRTEIGIQLFYPTDDYDDIIAFFEDWTEAEPEAYERFDRDEPIGVSWIWLDGATTQNRTIDVQKTLDGGNNFGSVTWVQIADEKTP